MKIFSGVLYVLWEVMKKIFQYLFPVFLVLLLFTIIRMVYRHKKYGYDYFDVFKRREKLDVKKMGLMDMIQRIDSNVIFLGNSYESDIVALTSMGILLVSCFPMEGVEINGIITDEYFTYRLSNGTTGKVENPFFKQKKDIQILEGKEIPIFGYVVFDSTSVLSFKEKADSKEVRFQRFYYELEHEMKEHKKYTKEELELLRKKFL